MWTMKIGVISDTHGDTHGWQAAITGPFAGVDLILHAGDIFYHGPRNPMPPGYDPAALAELINRAPAPVIIARGNCDSEVDQLVIEYPIQAPYAFVVIEACPPAVWRGLRIMVTHGTEFGLNNLGATSHGGRDFRAAYRAARPGPLAEKYDLDILVFGHTHAPLLERAGGALIMNPGSPTLPKSRVGEPQPTVGLIEDRTARIVTLDGRTILAMPVRPGSAGAA